MADDNEPLETHRETDAESAQLSAVSLIGDVRDFFLRNVRENGMKKPWNKLSEKEQELEINRATERAEKLVRDIVDIVAQGDFPVVHAIIDNFKIKSGEVTITSKGIADDEVLLSLNHAGKKAVKIVVADADQFDKQRSYVAADPDEPGLPGVKKDLTAEEVRGEPPAFEDDDGETEADENETFLDDDEQAAGGAALAQVEHSDLWWGGYNSRMARHLLSENPFDGRKKEGKDWAAGWKAADENPDAPETTPPADKGGDETPPHDPETGEILEDQGGAQTPGHNERKADNGLTVAGENPGQMKSQAEPTAFDDDVEPEDHIDRPGLEPAISTGEDRGEADPNEDQPLTEDEIWDLMEAGKTARQDGHAPDRSPHNVESVEHSHWLAGYNAEKKREQDRPADAGFDD